MKSLTLHPPIRRLVMIGACFIDTILSVPHFPTEDDKLRATSLARRRGGNVANTLEVLQQLPLDIELILITVLPAQNSPGTAFVRSSLGERVDTSRCIFREDHEEPASCYVLQSGETGSRTIVSYNELPNMTVEEFRAKVGSLEGDGRTWFHFEGREAPTSTACIEWVRATLPDAVVSVEVENPSREGLLGMAALADVVFFSKTWALAKGFGSRGELLRAQRGLAGLVCCTWGAEGAGVVGEGFLFESEAVEAKGKVADTIGAGDTWTAGMLHVLLSWDGAGSLEERAMMGVEFANRLAGRKVVQQGFGELSKVLDE